MGLFNEVLGADESLFANEEALDFEWVPKVLPFRELQQRSIAACIAPLLQQRNGRNIFVSGRPSVGKTAAIRWILRDLEETTDDVYAIYVNCWQKNTTYKVFVEICQLLGYSFVHNKKTEELFEVVKNIINKKAAVFVFDEVDKLEDVDFLYSILTDIYKKGIVLITNYADWLEDLDSRIMSRLMPQTTVFNEYSEGETREILKQRRDASFSQGVWSEEAFELVVQKAFELKDIRAGFFLMRESGLAAEEHSSRRILPEHANTALERIHNFTIKNSEDLEDDTRTILDIVKADSGKRIGELFELYQEKGGKNTYKTFQRKIERLARNKFVSVEKIGGGKEGNTTLVKYEAEGKKLTDF